MTKTVVIATNNAHKVEEIETALNFEGGNLKALRMRVWYPILRNPALRFSRMRA